MSIPTLSSIHAMDLKRPAFDMHQKSLTPQEAFKAGMDFEKSMLSSFLQTLLSQTSEEGTLFGSEQGAVFNGLFTEKLAENLTGTFKIAEAVANVLLKKQGVESSVDRSAEGSAKRFDGFRLSFRENQEETLEDILNKIMEKDDGKNNL